MGRRDMGLEDKSAGIGAVCPLKASVVELIAKKDFVIRHNEYLKEIKVGDELKDVPSIYIENLFTEGVL